MDLIPTRDEILRGETTDIYFRRTMEVLRATGKDRVRVTAEAIVKTFPDAWQIVPSIAVSSSQKAPYGPSMEKTVSKGKKRLPSSIASTSTSVPARRDSISSIPQRTAYP